MKHIIIVRGFSSSMETLSNITIYDGLKKIFECKGLELPNLDNKKNVSRINNGKYPLALEWSPRFKKNLWELKKVPGRSECKFHAANYARQLNGCIALGSYFKDIDNDGNLDVGASRKTMKKFHAALFPSKKAMCTVINEI